MKNRIFIILSMLVLLSGCVGVSSKGLFGTGVSVAFDPEGRKIVSGGDDKKVKVWSAANFKLITEGQHLDSVHSVAFSPDGNTIVSGSYDELITLWNPTGNRFLKGHSDTILSVAFNPNGTHLVSAGNDNTVRLWDLRTFQQLKISVNHESGVWRAVFSPDGKVVASADQDGIIKLWDISDKSKLDAHSKTVAEGDAQLFGNRPNNPPQPKQLNSNSLGMRFSRLPGGTFVMGSPEGEEARKDDEQQHQITISKPFYMQITEVTQGQWKTVMGTEPWTGNIRVKEGTNYAATWISREEAVEFCKKLSEREGALYRLPTEAEWEYACRAGTKTAWSFGNDAKLLDDYAWHQKNTSLEGEGYTHQVGLKKPNAFGLYDMHGNVWEWCYDYYKDDHYKTSFKRDPTGPTTGSSYVFRGGSWFDHTLRTRSAFRNSNTGEFSNFDLGFRLVRELD